MTTGDRPVVVVGSRPLSIDDVLALAHGRASAALDADPGLRARIRKGNDRLTRLLGEAGQVYGVTTGFGDSCESPVSAQLALELPRNLMRYHGCGTGRTLSELESAAVVAVRLAALARGWSGVREALLERLCDLLSRRILPVIPEEGSVGASGDLTPLSYLAALLAGEREALREGQVVEAARALREAGLEPLALGPKESLAVMNGTSVMTGLGCVAYERALRLARLAAVVTAMASDALRGEPAHFDDRIFAAKPHPGQRRFARWVREHLELDAGGKARGPGRIQDRYSIRCAPHVVGVLLDALPWIRTTLEVELNSANDNPLVDPETGDVLHGGNFYGGHVCFAMDGLKSAVANVADLIDRQTVLLCTPGFSNGLPANLVALSGPERVVHHGFKAMQISTSALAAEALKLTMPASAFSRSTECHNQDKVSMGTIAARDALRILDLTETVAAIGLLAVCQAADIRGVHEMKKRTREVHAAVRAVVPVNREDRRQDRDIAMVLDLLRRDRLPLGTLE